jgi:hypothetical protein
LSYSFREPEEPAVCECKYDEVHDRMDREDCPFHFDLLDDASAMQALGNGMRPTVGTETGDARKRRAKTA